MEYLKIEKVVSDQVFKMINIKGVIDTQIMYYDKCKKKELTLDQKGNRIKIDIWNDIIESAEIDKGNRVYLHNLQVKEIASKI